MSNEINKETEQKMQKLQLLEQSMQSFLMQKQQFQQQLIEMESALGELENTKEVYKIVGNIMVASDAKTVKEDLQGKKEACELRIKTLEKQESQIKDKASKLQEEVMKELKVNKE